MMMRTPSFVLALLTTVGVRASELVVCSSSTTVFGDDVTFQSSVVVAGNLIVGNDVTVHGSVFAGESFISGSDLYVRDSVAAVGRVVLGNDATVGGVVQSFGSSVTIGNDDTVGSIVAFGRVSLGNDDTVRGSIVAGGTVSEGNDDTIRGPIISGGPLAEDAYADLPYSAPVDGEEGWWSECDSFANSHSNTNIEIGAFITIPLLPQGCEDTVIRINSLKVSGKNGTIVIPQGARLYVNELEASYDGLSVKTSEKLNFPRCNNNVSPSSSSEESVDKFSSDWS